MPQPKVSVLWKIAEFMVRLFLGLLVIYALLSFLFGLLSSRVTDNALLALVLLVIALIVLWSMIPDWFRQLTQKALGKGGHREDR